MNTIQSINVGIGNGSLATSVCWLLEQAGITYDPCSRAISQEPKNRLVQKIFTSRPQHLTALLRASIVDCVIMGEDMLAEYSDQSEFIAITSIQLSKTTRTTNTRVISFVRTDSNYKDIKDLNGCAILSEYPRVTKRWLKKNGVVARIIPSTGSTEGIIATGVYDCGIGVTETGASLEKNNLRKLKIIMDAPVVIATRAERANDEQIQCFARMLAGVHVAQNYALLKMNAEKKNLPILIALLPALKSPTVHELSNKNSVAVETIVMKSDLTWLIVKLQNVGASGIIWHNINGIVA